jgi:predicted nicotinamide N-methyase
VTAEERAAFVRAETRLLAPPLVPEVVLHLAEESIPLWRRTEEELAEIGLPPPFWAFAWAGGQALARHVLDHPEIVAGRRVLDFAAGSGLVAIAAMKAGAARVVANEIDDFALAAIAINAAANGVAVEVAGGDMVGAVVAADVILAGDVCYERDMAARVIDWLAVEAARGANVLIGDPGRTYLPKDRLTLVARHDVPVTRELEDAEIKRSAVWALR